MMRFSLRDLLWLVTLSAVAIYGWQAQRERSRLRETQRTAEREAAGWRLLFEKSR